MWQQGSSGHIYQEFGICESISQEAELELGEFRKVYIRPLLDYISVPDSMSVLFV